MIGCQNFANNYIDGAVTNPGMPCGVIGGVSNACQDPLYCSNKTNTCVFEDTLRDQQDAKFITDYMCARGMNDDLINYSDNPDAIREYMKTVGSVSVLPPVSVNATFSNQNSEEDCNKQCEGKKNCFALYNKELSTCVVSENTDISTFLKAEQCRWDKPCKTYTLNACITDEKYEIVSQFLKEQDIPMFEKSENISLIT